MNNEEKILGLLEQITTTLNNHDKQLGLLEQINTKLVEHDKRFDCHDEQFKSINQQLSDIKNEQGYMWEDIKRIDNRLSSQQNELNILKQVK